MNLAGDPNERVRDREAARGERSPARRHSSRRLRERLIITDDKNPRYVNHDTRITARLIKCSRIKNANERNAERKAGRGGRSRGFAGVHGCRTILHPFRVEAAFFAISSACSRANRAHDVTRATRDALARAHARTRRERGGREEGRREQGVERKNRHDHRSHAGVR